MNIITFSEKVFNMKRLLLILILTLIFQSLTKADEVEEIEVEGISVGDSLLEFYSKKIIEERKRFFFKNKKFYTFAIGIKSYQYDLTKIIYLFYFLIHSLIKDRYENIK